jgi:segregation and condensation protein A
VPRIQLASFDGPLDLLLYLIRRDQIDIYDIPIAPITKRYMEYLDLMREMNLDVAGEFMVMAATLIHIKSKMLVPLNPTEAQTDEEAVDPREELVQRLLEFQRYRRRRACCTPRRSCAAPATRGLTRRCPASTTPARS